MSLRKKGICFIITTAAFFAFVFFPVYSHAATSVSLQIFSQTIPQGGTAVIMLTPKPKGILSVVTGKVGSRQVTFFPYGGRYIGFYSAPAKAAPRWYPVSVVVDGSLIKTAVGIKSSEFSVTTLPVVPELEQKGFAPKAVASNLKDDTPTLLTAASNPLPTPIFSESFRYPLDEVVVTGPFGDYYRQGSVTLEHLGVDLHAATGTPVYAVNDGKVVLTKELSNYGNTLMIDHGARIFSLYLHLERFAVTSGAMVKKGDVIGYSGDTGYAIGPHLHFSMWVNGTSIDPLAFISATRQAMQ